MYRSIRSSNKCTAADGPREKFPYAHPQYLFLLLLSKLLFPAFLLLLLLHLPLPQLRSAAGQAHGEGPCVPARPP